MRECSRVGVAKDGAERIGLGEECIVAVPLGRSTTAPAAELAASVRPARAARSRRLRGHENARRSDRRRIDAVQVAGQRQRQKTFRAPSRREAFAMLPQIGLDRKDRVVFRDIAGGSRIARRTRARSDTWSWRANARVPTPPARVPSRARARRSAAARHEARLSSGAARARRRCDDRDRAGRDIVRRTPARPFRRRTRRHRVHTRDADFVEHARNRVGLVMRRHDAFGRPSEPRPPSRKSQPTS